MRLGHAVMTYLVSFGLLSLSIRKSKFNPIRRPFVLAVTMVDRSLIVTTSCRDRQVLLCCFLSAGLSNKRREKNSDTSACYPNSEKSGSTEYKQDKSK